MMKKLSAYKIVITALFTSLVAVMTLLVQIPLPAGSGYMNPGDSIILTAAFLIHPVCALAAAGLGSLLADLLAGYAVFAPGSLLIKSIMVLIAYGLYRGLPLKNHPIRLILSGLCAEIWMAVAYFLYQYFLMGMGIAALESIPGNFMQGIICLLITLAVHPLVSRSEQIRKLLNRTWSS